MGLYATASTANAAAERVRHGGPFSDNRVGIFESHLINTETFSPQKTSSDHERDIASKKRQSFLRILVFIFRPFEMSLPIGEVAGICLHAQLFSVMANSTRGLPSATPTPHGGEST